MKKYVALARVEPRFAASGSKIFIELTIEGRRFAIPATVVDTPFFNPARKRD
jgi:glycine cleavage system aminomethyltransferase T